MIDRVPPHNLEIEQSVILACLCYQEVCVDVVEILKPDDFYRAGHQKIFDTIMRLYSGQKTIDTVTVSSALRDAGELESIGGDAYFAKLIDCPIPVDHEAYCRKIKEYATLRRIIEICNKTTQECFNPTDFDTILDTFQGRALGLDSFNQNDTFTDMPTLTEESIDRHQAVFEHKGRNGLPTGLVDLDRLTCGFQESDLIIIAARPSMGKSALMTNICNNMAQVGIPVCVFSLEMSKAQLYDRILASETAINSLKFRNGNLTQDDWIRMGEAKSKLEALPIYIDASPALTLYEIRRRTRRMKKIRGIKIAFIDYLQLIRGDGKKKRNYEVEDITQGMKGLAKELNIPVVLLSQLNRNCEHRDNKRPLLSDLRDSGSTEQDADVILFPYRHEQYIKQKYNEDGTKTDDFVKWEGKAELDVAKQRMGPTRSIDLVWIAKTTTFCNAMGGY